MPALRAQAWEPFGCADLQLWMRDDVRFSLQTRGRTSVRTGMLFPCHRCKISRIMQHRYVIAVHRLQQGFKYHQHAPLSTAPRLFQNPMGVVNIASAAQSTSPYVSAGWSPLSSKVDQASFGSVLNLPMTFPLTRPNGSGPNILESRENLRLSPTTKQCPSGIYMMFVSHHTVL